MATMKAKYLGQLRVECEHVASGTKMMTDSQVGYEPPRQKDDDRRSGR